MGWLCTNWREATARPTTCQANNLVELYRALRAVACQEDGTTLLPITRDHVGSSSE